MYSLLIVDDEKRERNIIKIFLQRYFENTFTIYEASNGNEAIEVFKKNNLDIIFMDIRMPGIDGIECIKMIREKNKSVYIVILTAYNYFEYAKEAIQIGVNDYLLKPPSRETITKTVNAFFEKSKESGLLNLDSDIIGESRKIIKNNLAVALAYNSVNNINIEKYFKVLNIQYKYSFCIVIKANNEQQIYNKKAKDKLEKNIEKILINKKIQYVQSFLQNKIIIYIFINEDLKPNNKFILNFGRQFFDELDNSSGIDTLKGIGQPYCRKDELYKSFDDVLKKLTNTDINETSDLIKYVKIISKRVRKEDYNKTCDVFSEFITQVELIDDDLDLVKTNILEIMALVTRSVLTAKYHQKYIGRLSNIITFNNVDEIRDFVFKYILSLIDILKQEKNTKKNITIENIKAYVYKHYSDDISTKSIASIFSLNQFYFSKLFKDYENKTFTDFLTEVRIDKSIQIMKNESKSIKDISTEVGYNDPNYFSRVFKKYMGLGPKEYWKKYI